MTISKSWINGICYVNIRECTLCGLYISMLSDGMIDLSKVAILLLTYCDAIEVELSCKPQCWILRVA